MNEALARKLFKLQPCCTMKACKKCGQEFSPRQKAQVFCCPKCKRAFFHRKTDEAIKARFEFIQHNNVPLPQNLSEQDKEAVELYTKRNYGIRAIARWQNRNHILIRRALIGAGVYRPKPEQNMLARKGTGVFSKVLQREKINQRESEWRHRMAVCLWNLRHGVAVEITCKSKRWKPASIWSRLRNRKICERWISSNPPATENLSEYRLVRIRRQRTAICLRNLRHGKAVEVTCREHGWNPSSIWNYVNKNKAYKKWKNAHPAKFENSKNYKNTRKFRWRSNKYPTERIFQAAIKLLLEESLVAFVPEKKLIHSRSRVDFEVNASIYLECKTCTKSTSFSRAMGQADLYKRDGREVWFVIPDDVSVRDDQLDALVQKGVRLMSETNLREKLSGREIQSCVQTKTTITRKFCKCCGKNGVILSRSLRGYERSYCVDCEGEVKRRIFDSQQNRWVIPPKTTITQSCCD